MVVIGIVVCKYGCIWVNKSGFVRVRMCVYCTCVCSCVCMCLCACVCAWVRGVGVVCVCELWVWVCAGEWVWVYDLHIYWSICLLSIYLAIYRYIYVCVYIYLSIYLSIFLSTLKCCWMSLHFFLSWLFLFYYFILFFSKSEFRACSEIDPSGWPAYVPFELGTQVSLTT